MPDRPARPPARGRAAAPRIIAGAWRGRRLATPAGLGTRPTAERVRQALFDMLVHAPWAHAPSPGFPAGGHGAIEGALVLDAFAGTGALGLEALSRGAAEAVFLERDPAALSVLRANLAACGAGARARVLPGEVRAAPQGSARGLVFLDPPYGEGLIGPAVAHLAARGWIAVGTLVVAETGRAEVPAALGELLAERTHGAARISVWRFG